MGARILVVDDNRLNRKLACDLLVMEGYDVQECEDAEEALDLLERGALPDLVLMDIALPGMDGLALTRRLRGDPRFAAMPVVALTAFAMKGDEEKAMRAGCAGYIAKPIDTRRLPAQVAQFLDAAARTRARLKIMVVEDHRIDLKLAGDCIEFGGHLALSSTTAEEAIARLGEGHPDVVLLDLNLPGMDGLSFLRLLKSDPVTRDLPVVAVTAYPDAFQRDELMAAGCAAYLEKPLEIRTLVHALERVSAKVRGTPPR
jgi:two-component system cell cycle response regulator